MLDDLVLYKDAGPLVPALHSYWLVIHVARGDRRHRRLRRRRARRRRSTWSRTGLERRGPAAGAGSWACCRRARRWTGSPTGCTRSASRSGPSPRSIAGPIWAEYAWGSLLELGPQGGLGVHHLGRLRRLPARPRDRRAGKGRAAAFSRWSASRRCCSTSWASTSSSAAEARTPTPDERKPRRESGARSGSSLRFRPGQRRNCSSSSGAIVRPLLASGGGAAGPHDGLATVTVVEEPHEQIDHRCEAPARPENEPEHGSRVDLGWTA